jgi:hypothetical protein
MGDPKLLEKRMEIAIFATPIGLNMYNFMLEETLNMFLKLYENIEHIRLALNKI